MCYFVVDGELYYPIIIVVSPSENTTAPESSSVGLIVGAVAAVGSVTIGVILIVTVIIVTRIRRGRIDLWKAER